MTFTSPYFLFLFLPLFFILYFLAAPKYKNLIGVVSGLIFFTWGQPVYLPFFLGLIFINFYLAKRIEAFREQKAARNALIGGIVINVLLLAFFKILVSYGTAWLPVWVPSGIITELDRNLMPLGLSYVVFQLISYLMDINNELCDSEKNWIDFTFYVLMFPKLITGPIVRYKSVSASLAQREITMASAASGIRRFIRGMAKKVLIADTIGRTISPSLQLDSPNFSTPLAWFILIGYALQLFFDFSGYTDMAIGLGEAMGFKFVENFNYPYISKSIAEFWRRWHISLSTWFRDYVFYPLEYKLRFIKKYRQQFTTLVVFLLTGLWHGFTPNFVIWGGIHGLALAGEISGLGKWLKTIWSPFQHAYALVVILFGWVFFCSPTPAYAVQFLGRLVGSQAGLSPMLDSAPGPLLAVDPWVWIAGAVGIFLSLPMNSFFTRWYEMNLKDRRVFQKISILWTDLVLLGLFIVNVVVITGNPSIASIYSGF